MEKFAFLNLLKAFETLSSAGASAHSDPPQEEQPAQKSTAERQNSAPQTVAEQPNMMASVLARHEQISNRLKNKR